MELSKETLVPADQGQTHCSVPKILAPNGATATCLTTMISVKLPVEQLTNSRNRHDSDLESPLFAQAFACIDPHSDTPFQRDGSFADWDQASLPDPADGMVKLPDGPLTVTERRSPLR
jgi:hypothetical protein